MYFVPYIYMYRNHKRTDNSKYYGLNIALISIYLSTLITIVIQILTFLRVFEDLILSDNTQSNALTMLVVGSGLFPRFIAYGSVLNSIFIYRQINEVVTKGELSLCEKLENISATEKCISIYMRKDPNFYKCNVFSENLYLENFCIDEVAKYNQDWKQYFGLDKSSRIRGCVHDLAVKNDYFLDTEVCEALSPEEGDPYPAWGNTVICYATLAYKKSDNSLCSRLPEYRDIETCDRGLESLKIYGN